MRNTIEEEKRNPKCKKLRLTSISRHFQVHPWNLLSTFWSIWKYVCWWGSQRITSKKYWILRLKLRKSKRRKSTGMYMPTQFYTLYDRYWQGFEGQLHEVTMWTRNQVISWKSIMHPTKKKVLCGQFNRISNRIKCIM